MKAFLHKLYLTFVKDDHYRFFLSGLGTTLLLTFASFLLGTALGIALCAALRAKRTELSGGELRVIGLCRTDALPSVSEQRGRCFIASFEKPAIRCDELDHARRSGCCR